MKSNNVEFIIMKMKVPKILTGMILVTILSTGISCSSSTVATTPCPADKDILSILTDTDGTQYKIATDGKVYKVIGSSCEYHSTYFDPSYESKNYVHRGDSVLIRTSEGTLFSTRNLFTETFERYSSIPSMFILSMADTNNYWNTMTLQSPLAPTVRDYVELRSCIFDGTCSFKDNRIDITDDPENPSNRVLKFTAVPPSATMVTSKCSIESTTTYFTKGKDLWYDARYYFTDNFPYSIADFESQWYDQSPGPRIVFSDGSLAVENKFGNKIKFRQASPVQVPKGKWVTIKIHFHFDEVNGRVELWQDGAKVLDVEGPTLPLYNAVQTNCEIGISATSDACVLYVDDVRLSETKLE
ncbi:MAG: heparin lyase I family protein [Ignavibacteria bacterium]|nr:heparin lyase I family protein [Ignavibacteria bacterium]